MIEWIAYYVLEPWGAMRDDDRAGVVAATMANLWSTGSKRYGPQDFLPRHETPKVMSAKAIYSGMALAFGRPKEGS